MLGFMGHSNSPSWSCRADWRATLTEVLDGMRVSMQSSLMRSALHCRLDAQEGQAHIAVLIEDLAVSSLMRSALRCRVDAQEGAHRQHRSVEVLNGMHGFVEVHNSPIRSRRAYWRARLKEVWDGMQVSSVCAFLAWCIKHTDRPCFMVQM